MPHTPLRPLRTVPARPFLGALLLLVLLAAAPAPRPGEAHAPAVVAGDHDKGGTGGG